MLQKILLVGFITTIYVSAMDQPEKHDCNGKCYDIVRDRIDEEILKIDKNAWLRPVRGALASIVESASYANEAVVITEQLVDINSKIPSQCHNFRFFNLLHKDHWYVSSVMSNVSKNIVVERFKNVSGATLATLLNEKAKIIDDRLSQEMHCCIYYKARWQYQKEMGFWKLQFGTAAEDIHYIALQGHRISSIQALSLFYAMSDGYYIQGDTDKGEQMFWSVKEGKECDVIPPNRDFIRQCSKNQCIDIMGSYRIVLGLARSEGTDSIMRTLYSKNGYRGIVIFAKPSFESFLCQQAFKKSKNNSDELVKLQTFATKTKLIGGFPKDNLLRMIRQQLIALGEI